MENGSFSTPVPSLIPAGQPVSVLTALSEGALRALRCWPALLMLLLGMLVSAGLLALIPAINLLNLAHRPVIAEMASRIRAWQIVDLFGLIYGPNAAGGAPVGSSDAAILFLRFAVMPLVGGIVSAFLYGGVLLTYREAALEFHFGRFLWGCWRWFGANLLMAFIQAGVFLATFLPLMTLVFFLNAGELLKIAGIGLVLVDLVLWLVVFEVARVRLVVNETRNPFQGIGQAIHDLFHNPLTFLFFYAAVLLVLFLVQLVFRLVINPIVPLDMLVLALVVQQGFILARLFCQAFRMAGVMILLKPDIIANKGGSIE